MIEDKALASVVQLVGVSSCKPQVVCLIPHHGMNVYERQPIDVSLLLSSFPSSLKIKQFFKKGKD